jgi:YcxB-like protein
MEPITLRFTPTGSDYARVTWRLSLRGMNLILMILAAPLILVLALLIGTSVVLFILQGRSSSGNSLQSLICVVPVFFMILISGGSPAIRALFTAYQVHRNPRLRSETTYTFSDENIIVKDSYSELKQDWSNYQKVIDSKEYYILVLTLSKRAGRFVPRRAFESPDQEAAFRDLLKRKLNFAG